MDTPMEVVEWLTYVFTGLGIVWLILFILVCIFEE